MGLAMLGNQLGDLGMASALSPSVQIPLGTRQSSRLPR